MEFSFRLIRLTLENHPLFENQTLEFRSNSQKKPNTYLILGNNGTGKTQFFKSLIAIFIHINTGQRWVNDWHFEITYAIGATKFTFYSKNPPEKFPEKGKISLLLNSFSPVDWYVFEAKDINALYNYQGIRAGSASNNIFLKNIYKNCFYNILNILIEQKNTETLQHIFSTIGIDMKIVPLFSTRGPSFVGFNKLINSQIFLSNETTIETKKTLIEDFLTEAQKRIKGKYITRLNEEEINEHSVSILNTLNRHPNLFIEKATIENGTIVINDNRKQGSEIENVNDLKRTIEILDSIDVIRLEGFRIFRKMRNNYVNLINANTLSSGEFRLVQLAASIGLATNEPSLVMIDEPEISLNPGWQFKIFDILKHHIKNHHQSTLMIASHSPFLTGDMDPKISEIIKLSRPDAANNEEVLEDELPKSNAIKSRIELISDQLKPYGWSIEQILFEVFEQVTDRNFHLSELVSDIIEQLQDDASDSESLQIKVNKLEKLSAAIKFDKADPMNIIIQNILKNVK